MPGVILYSSGTRVSSGAVINDATLIAGGNNSMWVSAGGTASNTLVRQSGRLLVFSGGSVNRPNVWAGGTLYLSSAAIATNIIESGGFVVVGQGANATFVPTTVKNLYLNNGASATVHSGTTVNSATVSSGCSIYVYSNGIVNDVTVFGGGMVVYANGSAIRTVVKGDATRYGYLAVSANANVDSVSVSSGGRLEIRSGATVTNIRESGGYVSIADGATATFAKTYPYNLTLHNGMTVHSGTTATRIYVESAGDLNVYSGGVASQVYVKASGTLAMWGGSAGLVTVSSGGTMGIYSGAKVGNLDASGGAEWTDRARLYVFPGGVLSAAAIGGGADLDVRSGGKVTGRLTIADGATVTVSAGGIIDFDVHFTLPGESAKLNDLSRVSGSPDFTLTVSETQDAGTYTLVGAGAAGFDKTLSVSTNTGVGLGTLSVGGELEYGDYTYRLAKDASQLLLTVDKYVPPPVVTLKADDLNGDARADIVMTITQSGHGAYGATGAWLIQSDQTAAWGDLSTRNEGWEVFGMGAATAGKATNDVYLKSTGNVIGAWTTDATGKVTGWETVGQFDADTQVLGLGDFNGDGQTDLLLRNTNGAVGCYFTSGDKTGWNYFQSLGDEWTVTAIGDLNGDGRDDVVLKHDAGFAGSWLTQADYTMAWANLDTLEEGFSIVGCGDFNADGTDDVLLQKGEYYGAWVVENGSVSDWMGIGTFAGTVEQIADFDADGWDDLRLRTAAGDLGAQLVKGRDNTFWYYYGSVGAEWSTSLAAI